MDFNVVFSISIVYVCNVRMVQMNERENGEMAEKLFRFTNNWVYMTDFHCFCVELCDWKVRWMWRFFFFVGFWLHRHLQISQYFFGICRESEFSLNKIPGVANSTIAVKFEKNWINTNTIIHFDFFKIQLNLCFEYD